MPNDKNNARNKKQPDIKTQNTKKTKGMWSGRFDTSTEEATRAINLSLTIDRRLYQEDIFGSIAYAEELKNSQVLNAKQAKSITEGLQQIQDEIQNGQFPFDESLEDIHMNIEARLTSIIGQDGERLHTGRSRNDQVATDMRLWMRAATKNVEKEITNLQSSLLLKAENTIDWIMPGFTHLQSAQPITFAHHCLAYHEMLQRDRERLLDAVKRNEQSPLGAGALAGSALPIDRNRLAKKLGFIKAMENSIDAVSARDFIIEFIANLAILATHLSRLAEDIILWASTPFNFVKLSHETSTGSSLMPQKQNPDGAELVRAKAAKLYGNLITILCVMKALPLAYAKDMQEDKAAMFDSFDQIILALNALSATINGLKPNRKKLRDALNSGFPEATDLADWLVQKLNMPFRQAHEITGKIVKQAEVCKCSALKELPLAQAQKISPLITQKALDSLTVEQSLARRNALGASAPVRVAEQIKRLKNN